MTDKRKEIWETLDAALTKSISNAYATGQSDERERILGLLEKALENHTKVLELRPTRSDSDVRHTICRAYQEAIDLVRGSNG